MSSSLASPAFQQQIAFVTGEQLRRALSPAAAVNALQVVLEAGLDPEHDSPRTRVATEAGLFLQMPSTWQDTVGTKLLTITPGNAQRGTPVIQGLYAIFGGVTQTPLAILDGIELTNLRTSAVSALGARVVADDGPKNLVVFGTGVQAWEHIRTFADVFNVSSLVVVGRTGVAAQVLAQRAQDELGLQSQVGTAQEVSGADLVICCTAATDPLFDGSLVSDRAIVVAMGAHDATSRELDDSLLNRSTVIVESRDSALREAGDVIQALESGAISDPEVLLTLADIVTGATSPVSGRPIVFKTTGMPWQDLAVAKAVLEVLDNSDSRSADALKSTV